MKKILKIGIGVLVVLVAVAAILVAIFGFDTKNGTTDVVDSEEAQLKEIIVSLDWTPNTNHTGLYVALENGYYEEAGFDVKIVQPPEGDAIAACSAGQVQYAVGYQDLLAPAFTSETPMDVTAVAALLQHNSSCIISKQGAGMESPKGLNGNTFLTWESPIELAMMENVVNKDGGDWSTVKLIPNTVTSEAEDVYANPDHAIWVYYGWGVINAQVSNLPVDSFFFKDINPVFDYYSPVLVANNDYIENNPEDTKAFLEATKKGYEFAIENPQEAAEILIKSDETGSLVGSEELVAESQAWMADQYVADAPQWGYIDKERWDAFYQWLVDEELSSDEILQAKGFTNDYLS